jgi:hypothetical protein
MTTIEIIMCIATVGMFATSIITSVFQGRKQKNEVTFGFTPASKDEFDKHTDWNAHEHEKLFAAIVSAKTAAHDELREFVRESNESREALGERINELLPAIGALKNNMEILNRKL